MNNNIILQKFHLAMKYLIHIITWIYFIFFVFDLFFQADRIQAMADLGFCMGGVMMYFIFMIFEINFNFIKYNKDKK